MKLKNWLVMGLATVLILALASSAMAAGFVGEEDIYILPAGEVITDDLYVGANEIIIDGTVDGDLFAAAGYVEINGTVTGDLFAAGGGVTINGVVEDDARVAGAGVTIDGVIGDDLFAAAGGNAAGFSTPVNLETRSIAQGLFIKPTAQVGGDLFVGAGSGQIAGAVDGDVYAGMGAMTFSAAVGGDAELASDALNVTSEADVAGTLRYSSSNEQAIPQGSAGRVEFDRVVQTTVEEPSFAEIAVSWVLRTILVLVGFGALGWLVFRFAPNAVANPAAVLKAEMGKSAVTGLLAAIGLMFIPLVSLVLVALVAVFWGGFPAVVLFLALFSVLALMWIFSPLITGYWLGRLALPQQTQLIAFLAGVGIIVLLSRVPILGWFVSLISFILALGAVLMLRRPAGPVAPEKIPVEKPIPAASV